MNETQLLLSPDPTNPKAKPDFLATVEPLHPAEINLPFELVFDGYTREPWSMSSTGATNTTAAVTTNDWKYCHLKSTDGRNRLPGFLKYLRDRKKAAIAKFEPMDVSHGNNKAILVVPFDQPSLESIPDGVDTNQLVYVMYLRDESLLESGQKERNGVSSQAQRIQMQQQQQQPVVEQPASVQQQKMQRKTVQRTHPKPIQTASKKGLLGNLLGARQRTENHLDLVRAPTRSDAATDLATSGAAAVISTFRTKISTDLRQFAVSSQTSTKITISLSTLVKEVPPSERDKLTMDILKYVVYEQVEETNDTWIAAKEPGFIDECTIVIYKEGYCPPEVLEDINRGELPDEVKGMARHVASEVVQGKRGKANDDGEVMRQNQVEDVTVLNTNKRDRRTLEQIQKDLLTETEDEKRRRFE